MKQCRIIYKDNLDMYALQFRDSSVEPWRKEYHYMLFELEDIKCKDYIECEDTYINSRIIQRLNRLIDLGYTLIVE